MLGKSANASEEATLFLRSLLIFLVSFSLSANDRALIVYTEEFPPYNFTENGEITGINIELVKASCKAVGIECVFKMFPWKRAMQMAMTGPNTALVSTARTAEREKSFKWVGPFSSGQTCVYKLAGRDDIQVKSVASMSRYIMGTSTDSAYIQILTTLGFEKAKNLILYDGKNNIVRPFSARRVDLIMGSATSIQMQLAHGQLELSDVIPVAIIDTSSVAGNYLALHPAIDDTVIESMQSALDKQLLSGAASAVELIFVKPIKTAIPNLVDKSLWNACMKEKSSFIAPL